jgi:hypothetical protein
LALSPTEEAQTRALLAQETAILSLAGNEPAIISTLGATDVSLSDLGAAASLADADLLLVRQGGTDKSISGAIVKAASSVTVPDASETVKGIVELATVAEAQAGTDTVRAVTPAGLAATAGKQMQSIDYTLSGNALTLKLNPTTLAFRSTTLTSGAPTLVSNASQITTTISSGSTGGTISGQQSSIAILAINNAGTMELAWCNLAGGINLDETTLINTTAEGGAGAANSANVIYSTTARTGVAFKVVGVFRSTQTTAGTWAQTPSLVQPVGGQALTSMASLGYGQTPQSVTRTNGVTYYNTGGRPIFLSAYLVNSVVGIFSSTFNINGAAAGSIGGYASGATNTVAYGSWLVPIGASYGFTGDSNINIRTVWEQK